MDRSAASNVIISVIGFKLKGIEIEVTEPNGEVKILKGGIRSTVCAVESQPIIHKQGSMQWFTNFNQRLLDKVRDHKYNNL
jgi:hypothetical protein